MKKKKSSNFISKRTPKHNGTMLPDMQDEFCLGLKIDLSSVHFMHLHFHIQRYTDRLKITNFSLFLPFKYYTNLRVI